MWKIIVFSLMVIAVVVAALGNRITAPQSVARVEQSQTAALSRIYAAGRVEGATSRIELRPPLSGRVTEVFVTEGQEVTAGQVLLSQDDRHFIHQVDLASAELAAARAELQRLLNGPTDHELGEAAAMYEAKVAELKHTQLTWDRIGQLHQASAIPAQQADDQRSHARRGSNPTWPRQRPDLDNLKTQPRADEVRLAETRVSAAQARLDWMQAELDRTQLKSPIAGQILRVDAKAGEMTGPNSPEAAIVMADLSRLTVRAYVEELDAPRIRVGMPATITADGVPGHEFPGRVVRVSPMMGPKSIRSDDPAERHDTKAREVWIDLTGPTEGLIFGLRVDVFFELEEPPLASRPPHDNKRQSNARRDSLGELF